MLPLATRRRRPVISGAAVLLDVLDRVLDGPDLFGVLVRNVDLERFFERQDELDQTKRISAQIVDENGLWFDVRFVDIELFLDDSLYFGRNVATCRHFCLQRIISPKPGEYALLAKSAASGRGRERAPGAV
jgi:hypothetical protein